MPTEPHGIKEALMVIASAWSVAFIVLLIFAVVTSEPSEPSTARVHVIFMLLIGAVTGSGWLWFRGELKQRRRTKDAN